MKQKIVINSSILHEKPAGLGVYAKNVILELHKLDKDIEVLSPVDIEGMEVKKITKYVKPSYKKKGGVVRLLWTQLVLPFKVKKSDIVYHPFQYLSIFCRAKQIITIHDFIPLHYPAVAKHQNRYYKILMPILLKKAYKIVCISENTKKDLMEFYDVDESKVSVIYNGYDNKLFNTNNINNNVLQKYKIDYNYMMVVGASYFHKNIEVAIEAIKEVDNCKIIVAGRDSDYILKLKDLAKKLNVEDKINFIGYVPDEDLPSLYYYSKAFLYPTLYEGFGLPILEAMACDSPVICKDNSCLKEVYGDAGLIFETKKELIDRINEALNNDDLREDIIKKGRENIKRFSWEKTAKEVYKLMK